MRVEFERQLAELHDELMAMGKLCERAIACAVKALLTGDAEQAAQAIAAEREIDGLERSIEALCHRLLLQQQPVAGDLRRVSSALKMITDMERIGDQAADIADISGKLRGEAAAQARSLGEMAEATIQMVAACIHAFVEQDLGRARMVIRLDDQVDALFVKTRDEIVGLIAKTPAEGAFALDLLMTAKYLERIGDHAVNLAEWVIFSITGTRSDKAE